MTEDRDARVEVFFYGLFMDEALLRGKGLRPENRRVASVEGFRLAIGGRATLVRCEGAKVYGVVYTLTRGEVEALYSEESVSAYRPEVVSARTADGRVAQALCFNLPAPPSVDEHNAQYASKLRELASRIGLPAEYVSSIR
jgi:cation transport regulator ChaC